LVHPHLNADFSSDMAWTYAMLLESAALIPQLYMFQKQASAGGDDDAIVELDLLTAHSVAALGFGRLVEFGFWYSSFHELASSSGSRMPGYVALIARQLAQLVLMTDFLCYYYTAVKNAAPLVLPRDFGGHRVNLPAIATTNKRRVTHDARTVLQSYHSLVV
jgi:ER lumen protein retaining receptor